MRLALFFLAASLWATTPVITFDSVGSPSPTSLRGDWITDISATHKIKWSLTSGVYSGACASASPPTCGIATRSGGVGNSTLHSVVVDGLIPSSTYFFSSNLCVR